MAETNANATIPAQETAPETAPVTAAAAIVADLTAQTSSEEQLETYELTGVDCLKVFVTDNVSYPYKVDNDHKMAGQTYKIYTYGGDKLGKVTSKAFIINSAHPFHADKAAGQVSTIMLTKNDEGKIGFAGHLTKQEVMGALKEQVQMKALENIEVTNEQALKFIFA